MDKTQVENIIQELKKQASSKDISNSQWIERLKTAADGSGGAVADFANEVNKMHEMKSYFSDAFSKNDGGIRDYMKTASVEGTSDGFIRTFYREPSIYKRVCPPITFTAEDSRKYITETTEKPTYVIFIENHQAPAMKMPMNKGADAQYFYSNRVRGSFFDYSTPIFKKDIRDFETCEYDIRAVVEENSIKDMDTLIDSIAFGRVNEVTDDANNHRLFEFTDGMTRDTLVESKKAITKQRIPLGCGVLNQSLLSEIEKWNRVEIGGDKAQAIFEDGLPALGKLNMFGVNWIPTIKQDVIPDNVIIYFGPVSYLGKFYEHQKPMAHITKKINEIHFHARATAGINIININAVAKIRFNAGYSVTGA